MRNNERRYPWEKGILVVGHLALIAALAVSALKARLDPAPRTLAPGSTMSILDSYTPEADRSSSR